MDQSQHFADHLAATIERVDCPLAVGLDPVLHKLPPNLTGHDADRLQQFSLGVIDAVAGIAAAIKIQSACYERFGAAGVAIIPSIIDRAHDQGLVVILDAKRGDIGISSEHYAAAAGEADAVTVNGYLGLGALQPFLDRGLGTFVLVRTSNPDGDAFQTARLADGTLVCERMAAMVADGGVRSIGERGLSSVGAVVGLTKVEEARVLRDAMPDQVFLVPGLGAQGGSAADLNHFARPNAEGLGTIGILATASRSIIYPETDSPATDGSWQLAIHAATRATADEIRAGLLM